jgi:hydrogenase maturation protein HypF
VAEDRASGVPAGIAARRFHRGLARGLARWAAAAAEISGVRLVVLAGGVMNNRTLARELPALLRGRGLNPLLPRNFPPGDGAISLGQAAWGQSLLL